MSDMLIMFKRVKPFLLVKINKKRLIKSVYIYIFFILVLGYKFVTFCVCAVLYISVLG